MRELSLHILDIAENSISAGANKVEISVNEDIEGDRLTIEISDNGKGMDAETAKKVLDPFVTSRTTRKVGLGLPLLKAAAEACNGGLTIESQPGKGTKILVTFQHNHIDRMPLGDLANTLLTLLLGTPEVNWVFSYQMDNESFFMDDSEIKRELNGVSLTEPSIMHIIREWVSNGVETVRLNAKENLCRQSNQSTI